MVSQPAKIAVTNQKGGVAKTTLSINVAGATAAAGYQTLVIDLDPQGYLTNGVGLAEEYTAESATLYDALQSPDQHSIEDLVAAHSEFDVVPANIDMFSLNQDLVSAMQGRLRLQMLLDDDSEQYDFVIIDCPPSLGLLTDNALLAATNLLIPAEAEETSIRALDILFKQIDTLETNFEVSIQERGIVVSNVDYPLDNDQRDMLQWFEQNFADYVPVFEVRRRAAIKRAYNNGVSIFAHDEECDQTPEFERIADHLATELLGPKQ